MYDSESSLQQQRMCPPSRRIQNAWALCFFVFIYLHYPILLQKKFYEFSSSQLRCTLVFPAIFIPEMMQLNSLCVVLLLTLSRVAFAALEYVANDQAVRYMISSSRMTKRSTVFSVHTAPRFKAKPALPVGDRFSVGKRQSSQCPSGSFLCEDPDGGCCKFLHLVNLLPCHLNKNRN